MRSSRLADMVGLAALTSVAVFPPHAQAAPILFDVLGTFSDNSSTLLSGALTIDPTTGMVESFFFNIPTMTTGVTTLAGALFDPATANVFHFTHPGGSEIDMRLLGAPPNSETLFLEIPQTSLIGYDGGALEESVNTGSTILSTGYQSGPQSNPFIKLAADGSITPVPEPPSFFLFAGGLLALSWFSVRVIRIESPISPERSLQS